MNAMLDAALEYESLGFHPMPLDGKIPHKVQWQTRRLDDPNLIRRAWTKWPDANVGLRTGGGFIVLDVDLRKGGEASLERLCEGRTLPETATAATGGGGWHFWFRVPASEAIRNRGGFLGLPGIDIKGERGQVVVEPSIHPETCREYVWTRHLRSGIADCPDWLLALLKPDRRGEESSDREIVPLPADLRDGQAGILADELIRKFPVPCYGHRNDLMVKCIASVV
jgi:Bifunctional DNA primase/polymerase, N-terminal